MRSLQKRGTVAALNGASDDDAVTEQAPGDTATETRRSGGGHRLTVAVAVAAVVVVVDQITKSWALHRLSSGPIHVVWTLDFALSRNTGSSFSLFQGHAVILAVVAVVIMAALLTLAWRSPSDGRAAVLGLIVGGALGNLSDRLFRGDHGAVVDFIALHWWPTFNVADASIVVGCILLVVSFLRGPAAS